MKYLLHANLSTASYSTDYTLFGVFSTKQECLDFITGYNAKADAFIARNKDLVEAGTKDPTQDPKYKDITYEGSWSNGYRFVDITKDKNSKYKKLFDELEKEQKLGDKAEEKLVKKAEEEGLVFIEDDYCNKQLFRFDGDVEDYIDEFDGKPKCLCYYSE